MKIREIQGFVLLQVLNLIYFQFSLTSNAMNSIKIRKPLA